MPGSVMSVFSEADEFQAALRADGVLNLLVTGHGQFRARLTRVTLDHIHLSADDEYLARIAFIAMPADTLFVSLPSDDQPGLIWNGMEMRAGEMLTLGSGHQIHSRTDGLCHWGAIRIPAEELSQYARALSGGSFGLPPVARWRPQRAALRQLRHLHQAAVRTAKAQSGVLADKEAVHGLEQQIIHALVESLSPGPVDEETETACRHRHILARFEVLLEAHPLASTTEIGAALGVSDRMLRECCRKSLGMGPSRYRRLRRMQLVYYTLRHEDSAMASVSAVARRYGFLNLGRFATSYRALYGELPSATLRRHHRIAELTLGRPRVKVS